MVWWFLQQLPVLPHNTQYNTIQNTPTWSTLQRSVEAGVEAEEVHVRRTWQTTFTFMVTFTLYFDFDIFWQLVSLWLFQNWGSILNLAIQRKTVLYLTVCPGRALLSPATVTRSGPAWEEGNGDLWWHRLKVDWRSLSDVNEMVMISWTSHRDSIRTSLRGGNGDLWWRRLMVD